MTMSTKRKAPGKLAQPVAKSSAKLPSRSTIDESHTSVAKADTLPASQPEAIDISSDEASDEDFSDMEDTPAVNGDRDSKTNGDVPEEDAEEDGETSPSFGELLRGNEAIDVPTLLQNAGNAVTAPARTVIAPPPHQSLTTVLTQALKTDDVDLLESCLHTTDLPTIRNTIENIESTLAGNLLNKLAARLYRRPGRAGSLMTWVQWTLIAHGGALASQPKVIQGLSGLQKVLAERAKGLNSLLALKGKLDMLEGQMDMRRKMQRISGLIGHEEDSDDEDAVWVEGEDSDDLANGIPTRRKGAADEDEDDDELIMNGVGGSSDEEDESEVEEDDSDDGEEDLDEDEVDHDDVDESMGEEEDSDVEAAAPPSKLQKVARTFGKRK